MAGTRGAAMRRIAGAGGGAGGGAGTRGGLGRVAALAVGLAVLSALVFADGARAGTYRVARCGWGVGAELPPVEAAPWSGSVSDSCGQPGGGVRFEILPTADGGDSLARTFFTAPAGTSIAAVGAVWSTTTQPIVVLQTGIEEPGGWRPLASLGETHVPLRPFAVAVPAGTESLEFRLACILAVEYCLGGPPSRGLVREVTLTLADPSAPAVSMVGAALDGSWVRGTVGLEGRAADEGAGVARLEGRIDGAPLAVAPVGCAVATIEGEVRATTMRPCPQTAAAPLALDTTEVPDGLRRVSACAVDFSGNVGCAEEAPLAVDNSAPALDFVGAAAGGIALVLRDGFSGPAAGTIAVRQVGSGDWRQLPADFHRTGPGEATLRASVPTLPAGAYVFRATATDGAGNEAAATLQVSGEPAEIRRQASEGRGRGGHGSGRPDGRGGKGDKSGAKGARGDGGPAHLVAYLTAGGDRRVAANSGDAPDRGPRLAVPFGAAAQVRGRLTGPGGDGVAGRWLRIAVRPARGSRRPASVRRVETDARGRFALALPTGPSRKVVVSFVGGNGLAAVRHRPLDLGVRAGVILAATPTTLSTGDTVELRGRVRRGSARFGSRGKLVAIQYLERASGRWRPALVVRTDAKGRFETYYRFRYVTGLARIRLRASAPAEGGWPYARGSSPPVIVEVHGR